MSLTKTTRSKTRKPLVLKGERGASMVEGEKSKNPLFYRLKSIFSGAQKHRKHSRVLVTYCDHSSKGVQVFRIFAGPLGPPLMHLNTLILKGKR